MSLIKRNEIILKNKLVDQTKRLSRILNQQTIVCKERENILCVCKIKILNYRIRYLTITKRIKQ